MKPWVLPAAIFASIWAFLVVTSPGIPIVWDEHQYLFRAQRIREWFSLQQFPFWRESIRANWLFISYAEGHPAGFAIPIALGQWLAGPWTDPLTAARLGPITLFSAASTAVALRLLKDCGIVAAVVAPVALLTFPRLFSEAHFATQDGQLTAWWLVLWVVQASVPSTARDTVRWGVVLGLTTAVKFTGWLAWAPTIASQLIHRNFAAVSRLLVILPVALVVFFVLNPPLWHDPIAGMTEHFSRSLNRATSVNIQMQFLGRIYHLEDPLPWYNTLVWLVFVTPIATLVLGMVGLWHAIAKPTVWSVTLILHWVTMMIVRALPSAPPHDGIRLFLPAFGFWCVFAGIGAQRIVEASRTLSSAPRRWAVRSALVVALAAGAINLARYYPQTLSHYNVIAGGLRGANDKGMEAAYWWDGLDEDALGWLNDHTASDEAIAFSSIYNVGRLKEWGKLRPEVVDPREKRFKW